MNSFWQRPPLSSEMENSHEIYKGGNCSFAAGSSGSVVPELLSSFTVSDGDFPFSVISVIRIGFL